MSELKVGDQVRVKSTADGSDAYYAGKVGTVETLGMWYQVHIHGTNQRPYLNPDNLIRDYRK